MLDLELRISRYERYLRHIYGTLSQEVLNRTDGAINLTGEQAYLLYKLASCGKTPNASEIRKRGFYHGTNASYTFSCLENYGLITRDKDTQDRRVTYVNVTILGEELGSQLRLTMAQLERSKELI